MLFMKILQFLYPIIWQKFVRCKVKRAMDAMVQNVRLFGKKCVCIEIIEQKMCF